MAEHAHCADGHGESHLQAGHVFPVSHLAVHVFGRRSTGVSSWSAINHACLPKPPSVLRLMFLPSAEGRCHSCSDGLPISSCAGSQANVHRQASWPLLAKKLSWKSFRYRLHYTGSEWPDPLSIVLVWTVYMAMMRGKTLGDI